jgi:hypothetical protein
VQVPAGDHYLHIGQVRRYELTDGPPLVHFKGKFRQLEDEYDAALPLSWRSMVNRDATERRPGRQKLMNNEHLAGVGRFVSAGLALLLRGRAPMPHEARGLVCAGLDALPAPP